MTRGKRRRVVGVVVSDRMDKSVVVEVKRLVKHPLYRKYIRRRTKLMAHDEENTARVGDRVELVETRRLSKRKSWRLVQVMEKAPVITKVAALEPTIEETAPVEAEAAAPDPETAESEIESTPAAGETVEPETEAAPPDTHADATEGETRMTPDKPEGCPPEAGDNPE